MVTGLSHIAVRCSDISESTRFYTEVIGMKEAFRMLADDGSLSTVYLYIAPGQYIELFANGTKPGSTGADVIGLCHICLETPDIHKAYHGLKAKGITPDTEIRRGKSNCLLFFARDPDGNRLEFMELTEDSMQREADRRLAR